MPSTAAVLNNPHNEGLSKMAEHSMDSTTIIKKMPSSGTQLCARPNQDFVRQQSEIVQRYALELGSAFQYWNAAGPRLFEFVQHLLQINRIALARLLLGCNVAALQTLLLTKLIASRSTLALRAIAWSAWDSKQGRQLRKKVEFEFFVLILGYGNGFALIIFWPGWVLVGLAYLVFLVSTWAG